ncbi:hypothetical protein K469DRAFT_51437 [Zopfia rhizophila CBS 207.26]|uniref:Uncharacterized protein n=1 Tax=Zopfia rhizophila CBS 207.26 TaxID=1314779 RepID=A0A6A6D950_9PEZI|nr:hypothetical protein K469DRAFT_51437 [Zopfia rhizophila CBS 207.26]
MQIIHKIHRKRVGVLRRSMNKWWRLAGLKGQPKCADEMGEDELQVDWTKAIAPRLEGRIKEVSSTLFKIWGDERVETRSVNPGPRRVFFFKQLQIYVFYANIMLLVAGIRPMEFI